MRQPSAAVARFGLTAAILAAVLVVACGGPPASGLHAAWTIEPAAPTTGTSTEVHVRLTDADQRPVVGARLMVEAHMSHPGMPPVAVAAHDAGDGVYQARVDFFMTGDWTLVLAGELPGGGRVIFDYPVPGVRAAP